MLYIDRRSGTIKLTRGDSARISVEIINDLTKEPYQMGDADTLKLTVKRSPSDEEFVFQKSAQGSTEFNIRPEDTKDSDFGNYAYDVELTTSAGDVYTIVPVSTFIILEEVS